ncbi:YhcH/YjgK/YiaL family protein [Uliginosibacterium sp. sgz301328]|uniref:YhcH/YjgK/YiaL family protein n=1 Tax=Uliginosibacterium sp. sgz301328 TaxID=3243764 RepID=UPI00359E1D73
MYFGHIDSVADADKVYPAAIAKALRYLATTDLAALAPGKYSIQGDDIYVQVIDTPTRDLSETRPEFHHEYIDVHCLVHGKERIGFATDTHDHKVVESLPERDLYFYDSAGPHENFLTMTPGSFAVFFPWDVHRPAVADGEPMAIRKIVIKVAMRALEQRS